MPVFAGGLADFVASIHADHDSWAAYDDTDNTSRTEEN